MKHRKFPSSHHHGSLTACVVFTMAALAATSLQAQTSWTGNANQTWTGAAWSSSVPTSGSAITLNPTGAFGLTVNTAAVGASLDFSSANNVSLAISGSNRLTLSGNLTDTGSGNADINLGTASATPLLSAGTIAARNLNVNNTNSANQTILSATAVNLANEFRLSGQTGTGAFMSFGGNLTVGVQFLVNNNSANAASSTYTQTGGTLRINNTSYGLTLGAEILSAGITHGNNTFDLNGGAIEAGRIGVYNDNGNNDGITRFGSSNGRINFNEGTFRPLDNTTGTLNIQNGRAYGSFNGTGTKDMQLNTSAPLAIALASTGTHTFETVGAGNTIVVSPSARIIDQTSGGTLQKTGAGTLVLTGGNTANTNTWTGATTVSGGTLSVDYNRIAGQAATGGTDSLSNAYSADSQLVLNGGNFSLVGRGSAAASSLTNQTLGAGGFTFNVTNTTGLVFGQAVTNANLPSGTYIRRVVSGTQIELSAMSTSTASQTGQTLDFGAATFANTQTVNSVSLTQTSTVTVTPGTGTATSLLSFGNVTGAGGLTKAGTGRLALTGNLTYAGNTSVSAGTLEFAPASGSSTLTNITGVAGTNIVKSGGGTTIFSGASNSANSFAGALSVTGGTLQIGNSGLSNSNNGRMGSVSSISVGSGATLTLAASNALNSGAPITLSGTLNTVAGAATYTNVLGALTMNGGTLTTNTSPSTSFQTYILNGDVTIGGTAASLINASQALNGFNGVNLASSTANVTRTFTVNDATSSSAADLTVSVPLLNSSNGAGLSNLTKAGAGTMVLSANNTYTGTTTISAGTLQIGAAGTTGSLFASSTITNNSALSFNRTNTLTQGADFGTISGTGTLTQAGSGTLVLGSANAYSGTTTISAGTLNLQNATGLGTTAGGTSVTSGAALQLQGGITVGAEALTLSGTGIIATGALLNVSGNNTYGGAITRAADTTIGSTTGTLTLSGTMGGDFATTFAGEGNITGSGVISGTAGIAKTGAGTLTLSAANSFTGATTVSAGKLAVNGSTSASSVVGVSSGGTLAGSGTVGGNATIASGGTLAPGNSPGVLTVSGTTTLNSGSVFEWEIDTAQSNPETRGVAYDGLNTSSLAGSGAIFKIMLTGTQDFADTFWNQTRTWTDIFKSADNGTNLSNWASVFSGGFQYAYNGQSVAPTTQGSFTSNGSSLTWSAVPEPSSALAGIAILAGLIHRRRRAVLA